MTQKITVAVGAVVLLVAIFLAALHAPPDSEPVDPETDAVSGASSDAYQEVIFPPPGDDYEVIGVADGLKSFLVKYDETLIRGGEPYNGTAARTLKKYGVKTIISITPNDQERKFCANNGFELVEVEFSKDPGPSKESLDLYLQTIKNGSAPFYVHCHGGTHRGGILGMVYRMHVRNWTYEKALIEFGLLGGSLMKDHKMTGVVKSYGKSDEEPAL